MLNEDEHHHISNPDLWGRRLSPVQRQGVDEAKDDKTRNLILQNQPWFLPETSKNQKSLCAIGAT
jgi:hypothetical protein